MIPLDPNEDCALNKGNCIMSKKKDHSCACQVGDDQLEFVRLLRGASKPCGKVLKSSRYSMKVSFWGDSCKVLILEMLLSRLICVSAQLHGLTGILACARLVVCSAMCI